MKRVVPERRLLNRLALSVLVLALGLPGLAEPSKSELGEEIISRYRAALDKQSESLKDVAMDVTMEASIPKLKKHGRLSALRRISSLGAITYKVLGFSGDNTVKKEVMARFMTAEVKAADGDDDEKSEKQKKKQDISISAENYKFKYKGVSEREGMQVHVFELKPRRKRVGLFKGELWVDPATYLPVREAGRLVKNPSIFIKRMEFVRKYVIRDGIAWLTTLDSRTDTRIVGRAELHISYDNFHRHPRGEEVDEVASR